MDELQQKHEVLTIHCEAIEKSKLQQEEEFKVKHEEELVKSEEMKTDLQKTIETVIIIYFFSQCFKFNLISFIFLNTQIQLEKNELDVEKETINSEIENIKIQLLEKTEEFVKLDEESCDKINLKDAEIVKLQNQLEETENKYQVRFFISLITNYIHKTQLREMLILDR